MAGPLSLYREDYDNQLIEHMAEGYTYESFAGKIGVNRDTIYEWEKHHPSFSDAKKVARSAQLYANEKTLKKMADGKLKLGNVTAQIFIMKNCHGWTDRNEVTQSAQIVVRLDPEDANL